MLIEDANNDPSDELDEVAKFLNDVLDEPKTKTTLPNLTPGCVNFLTYMMVTIDQKTLIWLK